LLHHLPLTEISSRDLSYAGVKKAYYAIVAPLFPSGRVDLIDDVVLMMKMEIMRNDIYDVEMACFRDELDNIVEEEDVGRICFLGGNNSSGTKKYQRSNSSDGGNTGDGVKIAGGVIGSGGKIGGISSFLEFSEKSEESFPDVVGK
ncbi:hypothetical protein Tco_0134327, partial [Tanacetum coccineum]